MRRAQRAVWRFFLRCKAAWRAAVRAWKDPEIALHALNGAEVPMDYQRFRVVRWDREGREIVPMRGGSGMEARRAYEMSCLLPGVERVEFWDNGARRDWWPRDNGMSNG